MFRQLNMLVILALALLSLPAGGCSSSDAPAPPTQQSDQPEDADTDQPDPGDNEAGSKVESTEPKELAETFVEEVPGSLVEFTMVLVPGDEARGVAPFYLGKHEVSWDEFAYWALCEDIKSEKKANALRVDELRPSTPHDTAKLYRGWGRANQPAISMSRLSAELYCQWLSEQTGKTYRLPTAAEWEYAFEKGGGKLDAALTPEQLAEVAWHAENSFDVELDFPDNRTMPLGSLAPNQLGIHDMLGNVAEWVTETDDRRVLRGGHFRTPADQFTGKHEDVEDQDVWNKNYPQTPKTKWGYVDADFPGLRLLCEP